eukprot:356878-Chlamydomonas_euryale.AAC.5
MTNSKTLLLHGLSNSPLPSPNTYTHIHIDAQVRWHSRTVLPPPARHVNVGQCNDRDAVGLFQPVGARHAYGNRRGGT